MSRLLSRVPRESKVAAVVLGAALLQVGLLAFLGLRSTDERREDLETALRGRAERVVTRSVVMAGQVHVAALRNDAEHELARRDRALEDRVRAALAVAPAFTHAFVVTSGGPLGPRLHEFRRPPVPAAPRTAIDPDARVTLRELDSQAITDPPVALARAQALAGNTDDSVARALALRIGWVAARRMHEEPTALALAERVLREFSAVLDDRGERADHAPFGTSAAAVVTDIWFRALLSQAGVGVLPFVDAVVDRRIRAQQMRHLMDDAAYVVERDACRELRDRAQIHLPPDRLRELDTTLAACDDLDAARDRVLAIPDRELRGALERGGGWLASGAGDSAISATLVRLPDADAGEPGETAASGGEGEGVALGVLFVAPRGAVLEGFLAPLRAGVDTPAGVALTVRDATGAPVVGPAGGDELVPQRPLGPALPDFTAGALLSDPSVLAGETARERRLWLWVLVGAGLAVIAASLLAVRAVLREVRLARMKGDFVSSLSHELRTPLTSLRMFVETLQDGRVRDAAEAQEYLDVIGRETDRLSTLVDRILQFAAFSRGRAPIELRSVDPREVAERAVELFRQRAKAAGATVELVGSQELPEVLLDRDAMIQVLLNLLDNAVKYGGEKGARIRVAVRAAGQRVRFEVEDDGAGVPERERELVFEEFYRGDESLSSRKQGAGIGLALCRRIVLAHGGKIVATDGPILGGALFAVTLPEAAVGRRLALAARAGGTG